MKTRCMMSGGSAPKAMRKNLIRLLLLGVALGVFTSFGQTFLPNPLKQLANSYSVWLLFAFAGGALVSRYRWAIVGGALIQYVALITYYVLIAVRFEGSGFSIASNVIWLVGGTLVGPIAGFCGRAFAYQARSSVYAISFMIAMILSESLYQFLQLRYIGEGIVFMTLAVVLTVALLHRSSQRVKVIMPTIVFTVAAYIGYAYVLTAIFS